MGPWRSPRSRFGPDAAVVGIDGPGGEGRSLLIEALLSSNRARTLTVARFEVSEEVDGPEIVEEGDVWTLRYREAGAWRAELIRYPPGNGWEAVDLFLDRPLLHHGADGILVEGPARSELSPDLSIYVLAPLARGSPLLRRERREMFRIPFGQYLRLSAGLPPEPEPEDGEWAEGSGEEEEEVLARFELSEEAEERLRDHIEHGVPVHRDCWTLPDRLKGLAGASLVVIHVPDEASRDRARSLAAEIPRIWDDEEVRSDLRAPHLPRRGERVRVVNLADPSDPELRKVIARIKRRIRDG